MRFRSTAFGVFLSCWACGSPPAKVEAPSPPATVAPSATSLETKPPTPEEAAAFLADVNRELKELGTYVQRMSWVKSTYITHDTELLAALATETLLEFQMRKIKESQRFRGLALSPDLQRQFYLLTYSAGLPAPSEPAERAELARLSSEMESVYGTGKYCSPRLLGKGDDPKSNASHSPSSASCSVSPRIRSCSRRSGPAGTRSRRRSDRSTSASWSSETRALRSSGSTTWVRSGAAPTT